MTDHSIQQILTITLLISEKILSTFEIVVPQS